FIFYILFTFNSFKLEVAQISSSFLKKNHLFYHYPKLRDNDNIFSRHLCSFFIYSKFYVIRSKKNQLNKLASCFVFSSFFFSENLQIQRKKQVQLNILTKAFKVGPDLPKSYCLAQCIAFKDEDLFVEDKTNDCFEFKANKGKEIATLNNLIEKSEEAKYEYIEKLQNNFQI
ncbi:hypothetical protein RFI_26648, partial [Reticulomyxa filosa]